MVCSSILLLVKLKPLSKLKYCWWRQENSIIFKEENGFFWFNENTQTLKCLWCCWWRWSEDHQNKNTSKEKNPKSEPASHLLASARESFRHTAWRWTTTRVASSAAQVRRLAVVCRHCFFWKIVLAPSSSTSYPKVFYPFNTCTSIDPSQREECHRRRHQRPARRSTRRKRRKSSR